MAKSSSSNSDNAAAKAAMERQKADAAAKAEAARKAREVEAAIEAARRDAANGGW